MLPERSDCGAPQHAPLLFDERRELAERVELADILVIATEERWGRDSIVHEGHTMWRERSMQSVDAVG